jgi:hypothetical protein
VSESYSSIEHDVARFAVEDAERDLLSMCIRNRGALELVTGRLGITPETMTDPRHRALLALLLDLYPARPDDDFLTIVLRVAQFRVHGSHRPDLANAGDLDGGFLYGIWTYRPAERRTLSVVCRFLIAAHAERVRDAVVEACIAALSRGSEPNQVVAHLRAAVDPDTTPGPDAPAAVLSIPPTKEH